MMLLDSFSPLGYTEFRTGPEVELFNSTILPNYDMNSEYGHRAVMVELDNTEYPEGDKDLIDMFPMSCDNSNMWKHKAVQDWTKEDTMYWVTDTVDRRGLQLLSMPFEITYIRGADLIEMSKQVFCEKLRAFPGGLAEYLFEELHRLILLTNSLEQPQVVPSTVMEISNYDGELHQSNEAKFLDLDSFPKQGVMEYKRDNRNTDSGYNTQTEDYEFKVGERDLYYPGYDMESEKPPPMKRPPGRPKGSGKKHPKKPRSVSVPEFLRDLLHNPEHCPKIIKWEDYSSGKFRFVRPDEVAKFWGMKKGNPKMSFEKFSRAMRYHYKHHVLESVPSARLVYQFGTKAPKFHTDDPNFERNVSSYSSR